MILLLQQGHLRSRLIKFSLQEFAHDGMLLVSIRCGYHGPDGYLANGRTDSFDCTPFDIAQIIVAFTGSVKAVAVYIIQHVHVECWGCGPGTDCKVLPGVTGHRNGVLNNRYEVDYH